MGKKGKKGSLKKTKGKEKGQKKKRPVELIAEHSTPEMKGLLLLTGTLILFLSLISFAYDPPYQHWIGAVGFSAGWLLHASFGICSYLFCSYLAWIACRLLRAKPIDELRLSSIHFSFFVGSCCILLSLIEDQYPSLAENLENLFYPVEHQRALPYHLGGLPFFWLYRDLPHFNLRHILNSLGVAIIFSGTAAVSFLFFFQIPLSEAINRLSNKLKKGEKPLFCPLPARERSQESSLRWVKLRTPFNSGSSEKPPLQLEQDLLQIMPERALTERPSLSQKESRSASSITISEPLQESGEAPRLPQKRVKSPESFKSFQLPKPNLLTVPKKIDQSLLKQNLRRQAEVLEETLLSFGIEAKVGQINCGPTITSFEVHPAIGVKVQKIKALENDIALNMEAASIRIIAPIPGKAAVGIEVPNAVPQEVSFREMLTAYQRREKKFKIPLLLGKAVNGDHVMSDLSKMPHLIIAGATGSGKSVCINTIVMSILYNAKPDEIRLLMIDPKKVELTPYSELPHMIAPVITAPQEAYTAMQWLVKEMEKRYELCNKLGVRNIDSFNNRTADREKEEQLGVEIPEKLPYIVGIIDELADLMMVSNCDMETPIARIAQMARAVGIHLILATQRPSREVITGLIKANFPTRICFNVSSGINSKIVLDTTGAEQLLGNGDMLFLPPGSSNLTRVQGAFIRDSDIQETLKEISKQAPPNYQIPSFQHMDTLFEESETEKGGADPLYEQALDVILKTRNASTTFLQRKLKIGYARAASIIDQLEAKGVLGPAEGSKPRTILVKE